MNILSLSLVQGLALALLVAAAGPVQASGWLDRLRPHCGQAFEGRVVTADPADRAFATSRLVMHVRRCGADTIEVPLHVGEDRSRTWVLTALDGGLHRLKHRHFHKNGEPDRVHGYGGESQGPATSARVEFPADPFSRELFAHQGLAASIANVWAVEIEPGRMFVYELRRPGRHFRVEFDLSRPVAPPPAPWGDSAG